jgi:hypothetical protein
MCVIEIRVAARRRVLLRASAIHSDDASPRCFDFPAGKRLRYSLHMTVQPLLACGPDFSALFLVVAPVVNGIVTFIAGCVCSAMGNTRLGCWIMGASAVFVSVFVVFVQFVH